MTSPIAAGGLMLDIVGALVLASAFMFKRARHRVLESGSFFSWNSALDLSLAKQTADAWVGGTLLAAGFGGQLVGAAGVRAGRVAVTVPLAAGIALTAVAFLYLGLRPWNVKRAIAHRLRQANSPDEWIGVLSSFGGRVGKEPRRGDETPADFGERVIGRRRWARLTAGRELPASLHQPYPD